MTDFVHAFRSWARTPRLTIALLACIAVAVGGAATVLTFVHSLLLRPLPFPEPERLVLLDPAREKTMGGRAYLSYPNFDDLRRTAKCVALEGATVTRLVVLTPGGAERLRGETVTPGYFRRLGLQPLLGRWFTDDEFAGRTERAVVLSHRIWQSRYGGDAALVGRPIQTRNGPMVLVGVMPPSFAGLAEDEGTDYWLAEKQHLHPAMHTERGEPTTLVFGQLATGSSLTQADTELRGLVAGLARAHPTENRDLAARFVPLAEKWRADFRRGLSMMLVGSLFLLAIGCGNVAILLLARLVTRERELAVRLSLGASRRQLLRLMIAESALLAIAGGVLGVLLSTWLAALFTRIAGTSLPAQVSVAFGFGPLGLSVAIVALTGIGFGLLPALLATRLDAASALRSGGRGLAAGALQGRPGRVLVIAQTALAVVLLVGAALFLRSYQRLRHADFGFRTASILRYQISPPAENHRTPDSLEAFYRDVDTDLRRLPGVRHVGYMAPTVPPYDADATRARLKGFDSGAGNGDLAVNLRYATHSAFEVLGVSLRHGRWFGPEDRRGGPAVALVSESLARRFASRGGEAIGRTLVLGRTEAIVIGVVADARWNGQRNRHPSGLDVFLSLEQFPQVARGVVFETAVAPRALIDAVRRTVVARDANVALHWIDTMEEALDFQTANERFWTVLVSAYGATAFLLAVLGLFGVLSHGVASRTREIGIRLALGATTGGIVRLIVRQGLALVGAGFATGLFFALLAGRLIESRLHGVSAADPPALAGVATVLLIVALLACLLPARYAARTDPNIALRAE